MANRYTRFATVCQAPGDAAQATAAGDGGGETTAAAPARIARARLMYAARRRANSASCMSESGPDANSAARRVLSATVATVAVLTVL